VGALFLSFRTEIHSFHPSQNPQNLTNLTVYSFQLELALTLSTEYLILAFILVQVFVLKSPGSWMTRDKLAWISWRSRDDLKFRKVFTNT